MEGLLDPDTHGVFGSGYAWSIRIQVQEAKNSKIFNLNFGLNFSKLLLGKFTKNKQKVKYCPCKL